MTLNDKRFLITGASSGIGKAVSRLLDEAGSELILVSRSTMNEDLHPRHTHIQADLLLEDDRDRLLSELKHTKLDGILHIAGIGIYKPLSSLPEQDFRDSLELNTIVPFILSKALIPNLLSSDLALVLTMGSLSGVNPMSDRVAYTTSKFATRGMILSLAKEYEDRTPHFCLISLGSTITTFGGKSIPKQIREAKLQIKPAFPVDWVAERIIETIVDKNRPAEVVLDPAEFEPAEVLGDSL